MITDVSRLRPYRCTIIASITSNGMRGEGEMLRHLGLTGDIRAPRGARPRSQGDAGRLASASACRVMVRQGCLASTPRRLGALLPVMRGRNSLAPAKAGENAAPARELERAAKHWLFDK